MTGVTHELFDARQRGDVRMYAAAAPRRTDVTAPEFSPGLAEAPALKVIP